MKIKKIIFTIFLFLPINVFATSVSPWATCADIDQSNNTINCELFANVFYGELTGYSAEIDLADGLYSLSSFETPFTNWKKEINNNRFDISSNDGIGYNGQNIFLGRFVLKILAKKSNSDYPVNVNKFTYKDADNVIGAAKISTIIKRSSDIEIQTTTTQQKVTTTSPEPAIQIQQFTVSGKPTSTYAIRKDNTLENISIEGHEINFLKELYNYNIVVGKNEKSLIINYKLTNPSYKVVVQGAKDLKIGQNIITLTVTDNEGSAKIYSIYVYKGTSVLNGDANLKNILIEHYDFDFEPDVYNYNLHIRNDSSLNFIIESNVATTSYQIDGNEDLHDGSVIIIKTIAQDNSSKEYKITVNFQVQTINPFLVYVPLSLIYGAMIVYICMALHRNGFKWGTRTLTESFRRR